MRPCSSTRDIKRLRIVDGRPCAFDFPVEGQTNTAWHCLAIEGSWKGHWMGAFSINPEHMRQMVEHCASSKVATPVDYEHSSVFGSNAPASGWIEPGNLQVRKGEAGASELWGRVDWTTNAADQVRSREYRYLSPTIVWNTRDRKSGEMGGASLHSVALTNKPFLEELPEVRLNSSMSLAHLFGDAAEEDPMDQAQFVAMCKALGLPESSTYDDVMVALGKTGAAVITLASAMQALNLQPNASRADVVGAVLALQQAAQSGTELERLRGEMRANKAREVIAQGLREGKITAEATPFYAICLEEAQQDPEKFAKKMSVMPKIVGLSLVQPPTNKDGAPPVPPEADGSMTAEDMQACHAAGMTVEEWRKVNAAADQGAPTITSPADWARRRQGGR